MNAEDKKYYDQYRKKYQGTSCPFCRNAPVADAHHILKRRPAVSKFLIGLCRVCHMRVHRYISLTDFLLVLMVEQEPERKQELYDYNDYYRQVIK